MGTDIIDEMVATVHLFLIKSNIEHGGRPYQSIPKAKLTTQVSERSACIMKLAILIDYNNTNPQVLVMEKLGVRLLVFMRLEGDCREDT